MAVGPSIRMPHWLAEITLRAAAVVPPIVLPEAPSISTPSFELPRSAVPDLSVPMKLPSTRFCVDVDPSISTPTRLPEMTCDPWPSPFDGHAGGVLDLDPCLGVAQVGLAGRVGADQVAGHDDTGGRRAGDQDADQVGRDHVARSDRRPRCGVGHAGLVVAQHGRAGGRQADDVVEDRVAERRRAGDFDAVALIRRR